MSDSAKKPWTEAHQAPLTTGFSGQDYEIGLPFPPSVDLPHPGTEPMSLASPEVQMETLLLSRPGSPTG